ncbi:MAG: response regulator [Candidatus Omnitrophota bacterium]
MKKLLIVDDEKEFRVLLKDIFEARGFICLTAGDGREAIKIAKNERPSVIIMDLIMPKMDGIETHNALKSDRNTKSIPIIAYTAQDPEVVAKKGEKALDIIDFVVKPFDTRALISSVEKALASLPKKPKKPREY